MEDRFITTGFSIMIYIFFYNRLPSVSAAQESIVALVRQRVSLPCECEAARIRGVVLTWTLLSDSSPLLATLYWNRTVVHPGGHSPRFSGRRYHVNTNYGDRWRGNLSINAVTTGDEGTYACRVFNDDSTTPTHCARVNLTVNVPVTSLSMIMLSQTNGDRSLKADEVVIIPERQRTFFKCYCHGAKPRATITWYLSGMLMTSRQQNTIGYASSRLELKSPTVLGHHNHTLRCRATGAGSSIVIQNVTIQIVAPILKPTIRGNTNLTLSNTLRAVLLTCFIRDSIPAATVHWSISKDKITQRKVPTNQTMDTRNGAAHNNAIAVSSTNHDRRNIDTFTPRNKQGTPLEDSGESYQIDITELASVTVNNNRAGKYDVMSQLLLPVDGRDDNKRVTCNALHSQPVPITSNSTESVHLKIRSPPVDMILDWTHRTVTEGESVSVGCTATGASPRPHGFVYWTNDTSPWKQRLGEFTSGEDSGSCTLRINNASRGEAGIYTCWANNDIQHGDIFKNFLLEVFYPPIILSRQHDPKIQDGKGVNATCIAEGNPAPELKWTISAELLSSTTQSFGKTVVSRLTIPPEDLQRYTKYDHLEITCTAINTIGKDTFTIQVTLDRPTTTTTKQPTIMTSVDIGLNGTTEGGVKLSLEQIFLIVTTTTSVLFLFGALVWMVRCRLRKDSWEGVANRTLRQPMDLQRCRSMVSPSAPILNVRQGQGYYMDMTLTRRPNYPGDQRTGVDVARLNDLVLLESSGSGNTTPPLLADGGGRLFTQQSVENTYDAIPTSNTSPASNSADQPRRRRILSSEGEFYDVPPPVRGTETIRRVQSRRLPDIPAIFQVTFTTGQQDAVGSQAHQDVVLRSVSRDARGTPEIPVLQFQSGGRSEVILREEVQLIRKAHAKLRRVFSL